jgi:hypothetical protein
MSKPSNDAIAAVLQFVSPWAWSVTTWIDNGSIEPLKVVLKSHRSLPELFMRAWVFGGVCLLSKYSYDEFLRMLRWNALQPWAANFYSHFVGVSGLYAPKIKK